VPEAIERLERLAGLVAPDPDARALVTSTIAALEAARGQTEKATEMLARARDIVDRSGALIAIFFWNCGRAWISMGDLERAEADVLVAWEALGRMGGVGHYTGLSVLLAQVAYARGRYEEASRYAQVAHSLTRPNDVYDEASWRTTEAMVLARAGRFGEAEDLARESLALCAEGDFLLPHAQAQAGLGEVLRLAGRPAEAVEPLEEALRLYEQKCDLVAAAQTQARLDEARHS
jgi:tetratricopeptide (TPR) repeat protein